MDQFDGRICYTSNIALVLYSEKKGVKRTGTAMTPCQLTSDPQTGIDFDADHQLQVFLSSRRTLYMLKAPLGPSKILHHLTRRPSYYFSVIHTTRSAANRASTLPVRSIMSSSTTAQKPEILGVDELKTEAKWLKLEKIRWKDQEGKEVSRRAHCGGSVCIGSAGWPLVLYSGQHYGQEV